MAARSASVIRLDAVLGPTAVHVPCTSSFEHLSSNSSCHRDQVTLLPRSSMLGFLLTFAMAQSMAAGVAQTTVIVMRHCVRSTPEDGIGDVA
eukprot:3880334-Amphidinium_carterae.3